MHNDLVISCIQFTNCDSFHISSLQMHQTRNFAELFVLKLEGAYQNAVVERITELCLGVVNIQSKLTLPIDTKSNYPFVNLYIRQENQYIASSM
jgi:hypothetical protein